MIMTEYEVDQGIMETSKAIASFSTNRRYFPNSLERDETDRIHYLKIFLVRVFNHLKKSFGLPECENKPHKDLKIEEWKKLSLDHKHDLKILLIEDESKKLMTIKSFLFKSLAVQSLFPSWNI
jgi:hypothetical protein